MKHYRKLRMKMFAMHCTQEDLAEMFHKERYFIVNRMIGRTEFTVSEMVAVCEYLGIPRSEMIDYFYDDAKAFRSDEE